MSGAAADTRSADQRLMDMALMLAERELGDTWPNPSVGCVILKDQRVVGRGWTRSGGRPHAETEAIAAAGPLARGATAYVSLEPCSHHGKTPPCADALIAAGVNRVVAAVEDPNPKVSGAGLGKLRAAGIQVDHGLRRSEAERVNHGFFLRIGRNRPLFALKSATSLDGRIALAGGASQWITGPAARAAGHAIRARYDAILAGSGTILADNPTLNCRMPGFAGRPKVRIVLDRRGRVSDRHRVTDTADGPCWIYRSARGAVGGAEVRVIDVGAADFLAATVADMASAGLTRVLIEGGGDVAAAFLAAGLIDEVYWFSAGQALGGDALPAVGALRLDRLAAAPNFTTRNVIRFGEDTLRILERVH
jgi:diaminohydroxyphosphoribosylaminopyrimidine deaminase/5-amino-6-(5-phosphoribosylamino)uracil reductase